MSVPGIKNLPLSAWGFPFSGSLLISGPCGVESEAQIHSLAVDLQTIGVDIIRGGIWKPRTRPDTFQGIGAEGLGWLKAAGKAVQLPVMVEVAHPRHVEQALNAGIDIFWIGARTSVNPFLVQEIAESLRGVNIPVFVKNPINPDLDLWIGALERIYAAGIDKLGAIHRGFSTAEHSRYRNIPNWPIAIELKRRFPGLPLICDPSHICGNRSLLAEVAQTALDLDYNGLMLESHPDPARALSDKEQQLSPDQLKELLAGLIYRQSNVLDVVFQNQLEEMRHQIDKVDEELLNLMAERFRIARSIGHYKRENNMTILQVERWNDILRTRQQSGLTKELTKEFIFKMYELIHEESIHHQTLVMNAPEISKRES